MTQAHVASLLTEHDAQKEKKATDKEETLNEMRAEMTALFQSRGSGATVAGSVAGRGIKRASVGEVTAVAADAKEGVIEEANAEAAADALIVRFGAKFETWDPNLKARRLPVRSRLSLPIGPVHLPVESSRSSRTSTYVRSYLLFGLQRPL